MVVQYTRYKVGAKRRQAFLDAHREASAHLQFRCLRYELTHCADQDDWYTLRVEWNSHEELRRFATGAAGDAFRRAINGFAQDIQEQREWTLTEIVHKSTMPLIRIAEGFDSLPGGPPWNRLYPWILDHLHHKILVEHMAEQVNMSPRNFARVFTREFQIAPGDFLDRVRITAAKRDLKKRLESIEQIAVDRGFGSSSTMRRAFLRVLGIPPSEYRDRVRQRDRSNVGGPAGFGRPEQPQTVGATLGAAIAAG